MKWVDKKIFICLIPRRGKDKSKIFPSQGGKITREEVKDPPGGPDLRSASPPWICLLEAQDL